MKRILLLFIISICTCNLSNAQGLYDIALMASEDLDRMDDVFTKLSATGIFGTIDIYNINDATPTTSTMLNYDAILVWSWSSIVNSAAFGDNLAAYVDAGGGVVTSAFTTVSGYTIDGDFGNNYRLINESGEHFGSNMAVSISNTDHPIINTYTGFDGGSESYHGTGLIVVSDAIILGTWVGDGAPFAVYKENVGPAMARRVHLNFWPVSNDKVAGGWTAEGDKYIANALAWVAGGYCSSQVLTAPSGTISDGSGTLNYSNDLDCSWLIQPPGASTITLDFTSFHTESGFDIVYIYDGSSSSDVELGYYSGSDVPGTLTATSGSLYIEFSSDYSVSFPGWSANYTSQLSTSSPVASYSNNFNTTSNDFTGNGFSIETPEGFTNGAIHSLHPYDTAGLGNEINYIYQLNVPIVVSSTDPGIQFDEIVLVEPGDVGTVFGDEEFWDYVITEVSKDNGASWVPLLDGYDSDADVDWQSRYNSSSDASNNSTAIGDESLFKTRTLNLTDGSGILAGDEILLRFRMYSDQYTVGWGWAIDNLEIQTGSQSTGGNMEIDSLALVALYNSAGGGSWFDETNWLSGSVDTWYGINVQGDRVFSIDLVDNNLIGSIPPEIGDLTGLDSLFLWSNDFTGTNIPNEIGNLSNLKALDLYSTGIGGEIPASLVNCTQLSYLSLSDNELTGVLPAFLGSLTELTDLYLWGNNFTGALPDEFGNLTKLDWLSLSSNGLSGSLPSTLGNLTFLRYFSVTNNDLSGEIPVSFSNLTNLETLALGGNGFSGTIPAFIGTLTNLTKLYLWGNQFTGNIPTELSSLTNLVDFYIGTNQLDGPVPDYLNTFLNLSNLSVHDNNFERMPDVSTLSNLILLEVQNNRLTFDDIIPNLGVASETYNYSPQQSVGDIQNVEVPQGSDYTINLGFDTEISGSDYEWFLGEISVGTSTQPEFTITNFQNDHVGIYSAVITNTSVPELTLTSNDINLSIGAATGDLCLSRALEEYDSRIDRVIFNDLDNESSVVGDGICASYSDFTDLSTEVYAGQTVDVGFTLGTCEGGYEKGAKMYIDWNQDGLFSEEDELIAYTLELQSDTVPTKTYFEEDFYTIPEVSTGSYFLRVVVMETDDIANISGCGEYGWGETEDYMVNVISPSVDNEAPVVTLQSPPTTYVIGSGGVTVQANITDNVGLVSVGFFHGKISDISDESDVEQYNVVIPEESTSGVFEHTLTDADFGNLGIYYFFFSLDAAGNSAFSSPFPAKILSEFDSDALTLQGVRPVANSNEPKETDYRLFSVPVQNATVGSVLGVTGMDKEKFRVWQYNGSNAELTSTGAALTPGKGYWLIYQSGEVDLNFGGPAVQASRESPFTITLRSGINLIGNPYNFAISWGDVLSHNIAHGTINSGDLSGLVFYEGAFVDNGNGSLEITQGAFVQSNEPVTIELPFGSGSSRISSRVNRKGSNPLNAAVWDVPIDLEIEETSYRVSSIGMNPKAEDGRDKYDLQAMPYLQEYLEFNSINPEFGQERVSQDFVKTQDAYIWEYEATSSFDPGRATLSWDNQTFGDNDMGLMLYDEQQDKVINMREQNSYSFQLIDNYKFRIYFGNEEFLNEELKPRGITLGNAYPNPFIDFTRIPFNLSEESEVYNVRMTVYNMLGELVNVLVEDEFKSGFYSVIWDGSDVRNQQVSEGIYIYNLNVNHKKGSENLTGRLILGK